MKSERPKSDEDMLREWTGRLDAAGVPLCKETFAVVLEHWNNRDTTRLVIIESDGMVYLGLVRTK